MTNFIKVKNELTIKAMDVLKNLDINKPEHWETRVSGKKLPSRSYLSAQIGTDVNDCFLRYLFCLYNSDGGYSERKNHDFSDFLKRWYPDLCY